MDIGINNNLNLYEIENTSSKTGTEKLGKKLSDMDLDNVTDEELLETCKQFENYLVEQVIKGMEKTIMKDEDDESSSSYAKCFEDVKIQDYASKITEQTDLGIAKMLYESMKKN